MEWQKSSFSGIDDENCVELARSEDQLLLRESETPASVVATDPVPLRALLTFLKAAG
ncbi:protein of unknown function DUF397 [Actinobacteria bacterium OK074]|nr:protein of unknown function DUF397 [Actinobacteria bacterium OK074]